VVGLAEASLRDQGLRHVRFFKLIVDPAMRRQGIGSALLEEILALDEGREQLWLQSLASRDWRPGLVFLETHGFAHIESEIGMRCTALAAPPVSSVASIALDRAERPETCADDVARIHNAAFVSDVSFRPYTAMEMAPLLEDGELWIAVDGSRLVGFCRLERDRAATWLEAIAIDPDYQGRGLGAALAYRALETADVSPARPAGLNVSSVNHAALSLYRSLGFAPRREMCRFQASQHDVQAAIMRRRHSRR
jgi:ribosomal protein S18 acetylase RimI-like enzyme